MKILLSFCNTAHPTGFYQKLGLSPLAIFDSLENEITHWPNKKTKRKNKKKLNEIYRSKTWQLLQFFKK